MSTQTFTAKRQIGAKGEFKDQRVEVTLYFEKSLKNARHFIAGALADAEAAEPAEESDLSDVSHVLEVIYEALGEDGEDE
jgi:hypothetical protein